MIAKEIQITDFYNTSDLIYSNLEVFNNLNDLYDRIEHLKREFPCNKVFARRV